MGKKKKKTNTKLGQARNTVSVLGYPTQNIGIIESSLMRKCDFFYKFRCTKYKKGSHHSLPGGV